MIFFEEGKKVVSHRYSLLDLPRQYASTYFDVAYLA
jgi:hypothetical protein